MVRGQGEEKVRTGLPYDFELMEEIAENGATINMNDMHFPGKTDEEQIRTAWIFLRNTGFKNIEMDFSECTEEKKYEILKNYIQSDIKFSMDSITKEWHDILWGYIDGSDGYVIAKALEDGIIEELLTVFASLPVYAMYRHELNGVSYSAEDFPHKNMTKISLNYLSLIQSGMMDGIIMWSCANIQPAFYDNVFTKENNELMQTIAENETGICQILHAFCTMNENEFREEMDLVDEAYEKIEAFLSDQLQDEHIDE